MKLTTVQGSAPLDSSASATGIVPTISAYMGTPISAAITTPSGFLHRALGDPVVDQGADPDPQKQIREHLPQGEGYLPMILRLLAGGKKLWRQETRKMRTHRRIGIFTTS